MKHDFDNLIDRRGTYSIKYDPASHGVPEDVLPMWVADMDLQSPPCVLEAMSNHVKHGIFGYSEPDDGYFAAVRSWFSRRFDWRVERNWLTITPGVVSAVYVAVRALTNQGDGVVIQQPVYYPFSSAVNQTGRKLIVNRLIYDGERYSIDFDDFEQKIKRAKLFILCSPHNPVGRVWTREELCRMGELCLRHGVTVISDEIHQDFVYAGHRHLVFAGLDPRFAEITITCTAPSKTFNLAGLLHANIFISNNTLREKFRSEYESCGLSQPGVMGIVSCRAAYESGEEWLDELLVYLAGGMTLINKFLQERLPAIRLVKPEGTYLAWLDCTKLGHTASELDALVTNKAKLWLDGGSMFGAGGDGFQRVNIACPHSTLLKALERLHSAFAEKNLDYHSGTKT